MKIGKVCTKHPELQGSRSDKGECRGCCREYLAAWRAKNPDRANGVVARATAAQTRAWRQRNPERAAAQTRAWCQRNPERAAAIKRRYKDRHVEKIAADYAARRGVAKQATPAWANKFFIREAYALAKMREKVCGGRWHVDHIVPLRSKTVCGLHVEHNLCVIPALVNQRKGNTRWPDMP